MATSRADLLGRVKKLLALSTSSNVHEAAAAAAAAQAMITRHQLEAVLEADRAGDDDGTDPITDGSEAPLEIAKRPRRWRSALADGLARINGGVARSAERPDGTHLCFCGRQSDRAVTAALFEALSVRIEWLSASHGPGKPRQWHEAFRVGATDTIIERLLAPTDDDTATAGTSADDLNHRAALKRIEPIQAARQAAVDRFVAAHLRFGPGRGYRVDARGFASGRAAAAALPIPKR